MSDDLTLLPRGKTGEVVVRGPNVIDHYENNPAADRMAFVDGWFRTGDQGYLDDDGFLFITGRLKEIINRGGEKIAPREIDEVLVCAPGRLRSRGLRGAAHSPGRGCRGRRGPATRHGRHAQEIQAFAATHLADFKVPRQVVIVPKIPSEATGKQKRMALAAALGLVDAPGAVVEKTPFVAPRTPTEELIAGVFAQILGTTTGGSGEPIGIHDNFFRLGGESLMAVRVLGKIRQLLKVGLKVQDFFLGPTVADLARSVEAQQGGRRRDAAASPSRRLAEGAEAPLSFVQEGLWFLDQLEPANAAYNVYRAARLEGPLDLDVLERAIQEVVRRHNILRTTFPPGTGRGRRVIAPDLEAGAATGRPARPVAGRAAGRGRRLAVEDARTPFDLAQRSAAADHAGVAGARRTHATARGPPHRHRSLVDRRPLSRARRALRRLRRGPAVAVAGAGDRSTPISLPGKLQGRPQLEQQVAYWKQQLADLPPRLPLPTDRPRAVAGNPRGTRRFFELPPGLSKALVALSQKEGVTLYMTLLAAFDVLLSRRSPGATTSSSAPRSPTAIVASWRR